MAHSLTCQSIPELTGKNLSGWHIWRRNHNQGGALISCVQPAQRRLKTPVPDSYRWMFAPEVLGLCQAVYSIRLLFPGAGEPLVWAVEQSQGCWCREEGLLNGVPWPDVALQEEVFGLWLEPALLTLHSSAQWDLQGPWRQLDPLLQELKPFLLLLLSWVPGRFPISLDFTLHSIPAYFCYASLKCQWQ